jgi:hypothetical protein
VLAALRKPAGRSPLCIIPSLVRLRKLHSALTIAAGSHVSASRVAIEAYAHDGDISHLAWLVRAFHCPPCHSLERHGGLAQSEKFLYMTKTVKGAQPSAYMALLYRWSGVLWRVNLSVKDKFWRDIKELCQMAPVPGRAVYPYNATERNHLADSPGVKAGKKRPLASGELLHPFETESKVNCYYTDRIPCP